MPFSWNTMFSMSYNIIYNISCSPSPEPGLQGMHCCCFIKIVAAAAQIGQSVVSAAVQPWAGVLLCPALFVAMADHWRSKNTPMYPCMSCQIVPASSARGPASTARNRHPARAAHARPSIQQERPCIGIHAARHALPGIQGSRPGTGIQRARSSTGIQRARPGIGIQHEWPCIQHALPRINERCMTVGKAWPSPGKIFLLVLHHEPHPRAHQQNKIKNVSVDHKEFKQANVWRSVHWRPSSILSS